MLVRRHVLRVGKVSWCDFAQEECRIPPPGDGKVVISPVFVFETVCNVSSDMNVSAA